MLLDRYLFKQLGWATFFVALTLAAIILLTQSLRFLELVIDAGASGTAFWILTMLALPRFFEVILPLALSIAVLFIYNRLTQESEMSVMRAAGLSPLQLSRPALALGAIVTAFLLFITLWLGPTSLSLMQNMRQVIKAQYSSVLFREGIFNTVSDDITVYVRERAENGDLTGLLIYDSRDKKAGPVTIMATRGVIVQTDEGQQVVVYDGLRQTFNQKNGVLNRLDFTQYSVDLPEPEGVRIRWKEPEERTFFQLLNPDLSVKRDAENIYTFKVEAHRRIITPFMALSFCLISLCCILIGPVNRRGQSKRIITAAAAVVILQAAMLGASDLATKSPAGLWLMYLVTFLPIILGLFLMSPRTETLRHRLFYPQKREAA